MNEARKPKRHIEAPENCMGCGLCANLCPKNAISMVWSEDGFPIPQVDETACIECGLCTRGCIALEEPPAHEDDISKVRSYAAWHRDEKLLLESSSGGIFSALAEQIFAMGGCVFGVVWQDKETAAYTKAENMEELAAMRGSKYTPAVTDLVYREVKKELAERPVLFTGTPCLIHALKTYLRKDHDNLYTQEIVCHGTPSRLVLQKYIRDDERASGKKIASITFRDKSESWLRYSVTRHYTDGTTTSLKRKYDPFMRMFLSDAALKLCCHNCPYAHLPRQGDICLGDYWGVEHLHKDWPLNKGVSAIITNTQKGHNLLMKAQGSLELREEPFRNIYKGQSIIYIKRKSAVNPHREFALASLRSEKASLKAALHQARGHDFLFNRRVNSHNPFVFIALQVRKRLRKMKLIK